jgi:hypothetical protein
MASLFEDRSVFGTVVQRKCVGPVPMAAGDPELVPELQKMGVIVGWSKGATIFILQAPVELRTDPLLLHDWGVNVVKFVQAFSVRSHPRAFTWRTREHSLTFKRLNKCRDERSVDEHTWCSHMEAGVRRCDCLQYEDVSMPYGLLPRCPTHYPGPCRPVYQGCLDSLIIYYKRCKFILPSTDYEAIVRQRASILVLLAHRFSTESPLATLPRDLIHLILEKTVY